MVLVGGGMALAGWFNGRVPGLRTLCTDRVSQGAISVINRKTWGGKTINEVPV